MLALARSRATTSRLRDDLRAQTRWPVLDGVRGLAVISVVLYHALRLLVLGEGSEAAATFSPAWWPAATGRLALDAFFVLSGFLIVESWQAVRRRAGSLWLAVRQYTTRRAARVLPGYWVSLLVLIPLVAPHLLRSPADLALLAGVQQYLRPGLPSEVNVVYWSLTTEVHFYALAPLVGLALRRFGAPRTIAVCLVAAVWWQAAGPGGLPKSLFLGRLDQFVLGAALAAVVKAFDRGEVSRVVTVIQRRGVGLLLITLLLLLGTWQGAVLDGEATAMSAAMHPAVGLVMAALLLRMLTSTRRHVLENAWLRLAGLVSYGVYLFHYPVLEYGYDWAGLGPGASSPLMQVVAVTAGLTVASFVAGGISYVLIERPFLRRASPTTAQGPPAEPLATRTLATWPTIPATSTTSSASSA